MPTLQESALSSERPYPKLSEDEWMAVGKAFQQTLPDLRIDGKPPRTQVPPVKSEAW